MVVSIRFDYIKKCIEDGVVWLVPAQSEGGGYRKHIPYSSLISSVANENLNRPWNQVGLAVWTQDFGYPALRYSKSPYGFWGTNYQAIDNPHAVGFGSDIGIYSVTTNRSYCLEFWSLFTLSMPETNAFLHGSGMFTDNQASYTALMLQKDQGLLMWRIYHNGSNTGISRDDLDPRELADGKWHHIVCQWSWGSGHQIYIDGVLRYFTPTFSFTTFSARNIEFCISAYDIWDSDYRGHWPGLLAYSGFYDKAFTQEQIMDRYSLMVSPDEPVVSSNVVFSSSFYDLKLNTNYMSPIGDITIEPFDMATPSYLSGKLKGGAGVILNPSHEDGDFAVTLAGVNATNETWDIYFRSDASNDSGRLLVSNGYLLRRGYDGTNLATPTVGEWFLFSIIDGKHDLITRFSVPIWASDDQVVRVRYVADQIRIKVWLSSDDEPALWSSIAIDVDDRRCDTKTALVSGGEGVLYDSEYLRYVKSLSPDHLYEFKGSLEDTVGGLHFDDVGEQGVDWEFRSLHETDDGLGCGIDIHPMVKGFSTTGYLQLNNQYTVTWVTQYGRPFGGDAPYPTYMYSDNTYSGYGLLVRRLRDGGGFSIYSGQTTNVNVTTTDAINASSDGRIHHYAISVDNTDVKFYIDGSLQGTYTLGVWRRGLSPLVLGARDNGSSAPSESYGHHFGPIAIWKNSALTSGDITNMASKIAQKCDQSFDSWESMVATFAPTTRYKMDEPSGPIMYDSIGGVNATYTVTADTSYSQLGPVLSGEQKTAISHVNRSTYAFVLPKELLYDDIAVYTIMFWMRTNETGTASQLGESTSYKAAILNRHNNSDGKIYWFNNYSYADSYYNEASKSSAINDNTWHLVALESNWFTKSVTVYIDGVIQDSVYTGGQIGRIARKTKGEDWNWFKITGSICEMLVFDKTLTPAEHKRIYDSAVGSVQSHTPAATPNYSLWVHNISDTILRDSNMRGSSY